jgi:hypothetical protein
MLSFEEKEQLQEMLQLILGTLYQLSGLLGIGMMWKWLICKPAGRTVLFLIGFLVSIAFQVFGFEFLILSNALYTPILHVLRTIILWISWLGPFLILVNFTQVIVLYVSSNADKSLLGKCVCVGNIVVVGCLVLVYYGFLGLFGLLSGYPQKLTHQYETSDRNFVSVYEWSTMASGEECRIRVTSRMILPGLLIQVVPSEDECAYGPGSFKKIILPNDPQK